MPIYKTDGAGTASAIGQVTFGSQTIGKVYYGSTLVFEGTQVFNLTSAVNVNIATFLTGQGASTGSPVIINVAAGQVIGSNSAATPALVTGDLSGYTYEVTLNLAGEIQGAGNGGDAINATSNITINNTGAIRGGGGNGGAGGLGGYGTDVTNKEGPFYSSGTYVWWYGTTPATVQPSKWAGTTVFTNDTTGGGCTIYARRVGSYWYYPGGLAGGAEYYIGRGIHTVGVQGSGGAAGLGQGYNQTRTNGGSGSSGTYRAGRGGDGGNGGTWGVGGSNGATGSTGYYYATCNASTPAAGAAGSAGSSAGKAIDSGTATVTLLGAGVVNGDVV